MSGRIRHQGDQSLKARTSGFDHGSANRPERRLRALAKYRVLDFPLCRVTAVPGKLPRFAALARSGEAVSNPQDNRERNLKIAENEASRERKSDVRLTTWAIGITVVIALVVLAIFLKR